MQETDDEQFNYDSDESVEIIDIPEEEVGNREPGWLRCRSEASMLLFRRLSPRQRNSYLAATLGIIVLVVIIIVGSSPTTRDALDAGIFGRAPTPTATLAPGTDLFYMDGIPSWGHAFLDGHRLTHVPTIGDQPLQIPRGHHIVTWHADPFQAQSCTISVPPVFASDTCRVNEAVRLHPGLSAWIISLDASLAMLPDDQQTALVQTTQVALDKLQSTEIIRPGEQYAIDALAGGQLQETVTAETAVQPLRATLSFELDAAPDSQQTCAAEILVQDCQACRFFCSPPGFAPLTPPEVRQWNVLALIYSTWTYTTLAGHVIAQNQSNSADHLLALSITWDGTSWHAGIVFNPQVTSQGDLACLSAEEGIGSTGEYSITGGIAGDGAPVSWQFSAGPNLAAGCLASGMPSNVTATRTTLAPAYLLDRFGVILAANQASHEYWSQLPIADKYEQQLTRQLTTQPLL